VICVLSILLAAPVLTAVLPELHDSEQTTAERIVLVYIDTANSMPGGVDDYMRLAAHHDGHGGFDDGFFNSFLFLGTRSPSGGSYETGTATPEDWSAWADEILGPRGQLQKLEAAVAELEEKIHIGQVGVVVMIPRPNPDQGGAVRVQQVKDYVLSVASRFREGNYSHLDLSGFYWMSETSTGDDEVIRATAKSVHELSLSLYWIPYFEAVGVEVAREIGFDRVMLQPNFAFYSSGLERFSSVDSRIRSLGIGVEMELPMYSRNPELTDWRESFLLYMRASAVYHWEGLPYISYYYGNDFVRMSRDESTKRFYDMVYMHVKDRISGTGYPSEIDEAYRSFQARQDAKAMLVWQIVGGAVAVFGIILLLMAKAGVGPSSAPHK